MKRKTLRAGAILLAAALLLGGTGCGGKDYETYSIGGDNGGAAGQQTYGSGTDGGGIGNDGTGSGSYQTLPDTSPQMPGTGKGKLPLSQMDTSAYTGRFYTVQTLTDSQTGAKTVTTIVPNGWTAGVNVNWSVMNKSHPAMATLALTSPDGQVEIGAFSTQAFTQIDSVDTTGRLGNLTLHQDGEVSQSQRETYLNYRKADEYIQYYFSRGGVDAQLLESREVDPESESALRQFAEAQYAEMAAMLPQMIQTGYTSLEATGYDYSIIDQRYALNQNGQTTYMDVLSMGDCYSATMHSMTFDMHQTSWHVYYIYMMIAPSQELLDQYHDIYADVFENTRFESEFEYLKRQFGNQLEQIVAQNNMEILNDMHSYWMQQYQQYLNSPEAGTYDVGEVAQMWSDVIKEEDAYTTTEGDILKVSTRATGVWQNGDDIYVGTEGATDPPDGWTELPKSY